MWRPLGWCGVAALAIGAWVLDSDALRSACAFAVIGLLGIATPRAQRAVFVAVSGAAAALVAFDGTATLLDALPILFAGIVGWFFARTLVRGRTPLIARAIAAIDGPQALEDTRTLAYARGLTRLWAGYQFLLTLLAIVVFGVAHGAFAGIAPGWLPNPRLFGTVILPAAVAALFVGEFLLRPLLLPQAPRHTLWNFLARIVRVWPSLLDDGMIGGRKQGG